MKNRIVGILLLLALAVIGYQSYKLSTQGEAIASTHDTLQALSDTLHTVKTDIGTVSRKAAFTDVVDSKSRLLSKTQKRLMNAVEHTKQVEAAAVVEQRVELTGMRDTARSVTGDTLTFTRATDSLSYSVRVVPAAKLLLLDTLRLPNAVTVLQHETAGGTVIDVHNSNPLFKSAQVEGYVVKQKKPKTLKKILIGLIIGLAAGVAISH